MSKKKIHRLTAREKDKVSGAWETNKRTAKRLKKLWGLK